MPEVIPRAFPVGVTRKWRALAQRRKAHLVDLYNSGRWRLYYTEPEYLDRLREAVRMVDRWAATEEAALSGAPAEAATGEGTDADAVAPVIPKEESPRIDDPGFDSASVEDETEPDTFAAVSACSADGAIGSPVDADEFAGEWAVQSEPV